MPNDNALANATQTGVVIAAELVQPGAGLIADAVASLRDVYDAHAARKIERAGAALAASMARENISEGEARRLFDRASAGTVDAIAAGVRAILERASIHSEPYLAGLMGRYLRDDLEYDRAFKLLARALSDSDLDQISSMVGVAAVLAHFVSGENLEAALPHAKVALQSPSQAGDKVNIHLFLPSTEGDVLQVLTITDMDLGNGAGWDSSAFPYGAKLPGWFFTSTLRQWHALDRAKPIPEFRYVPYAPRPA